MTTEQMREVDRYAVEEVGLELPQMMENAGRVLSEHVQRVHNGAEEILVVAGNGGNGGGGMACARHLANRDFPVRVLLDRSPETLTGAAAHQYGILHHMDVSITTDPETLTQAEGPMTIVDALIGYGVEGEVRQPASDYIATINARLDPVISLDVPSGMDATTGESLGLAVTPDRTLTLALPKTGLSNTEQAVFLADIGIPSVVYERADIPYQNPFGDRGWVRLER